MFVGGAQAILRPSEGKSHLEHARELLVSAGLSSMSDLRALPRLPTGRWVVRLVTNPSPDFAQECDPLWCAAILGFAGPTFYSSERPAVWTQDRLSRAITLHQVTDFYAH
jgi:hypothetical protein